MSTSPRWKPARAAGLFGSISVTVSPPRNCGFTRLTDSGGTGLVRTPSFFQTRSAPVLEAAFSGSLRSSFFSLSRSTSSRGYRRARGSPGTDSERSIPRLA